MNGVRIGIRRTGNEAEADAPDVFQGIAIGESAKQRDQGRFTKHNAPHPCTGQNAGCAQHWRSAVALDDNPAKSIYSYRHVQTRKQAH